MLLYGRSIVSAATCICVVDDDRSSRFALSSLVRSLGHDVEAFESGREFLKWLAQNRPSCVISDVQMPGMSGIEMFQRMNDMGIQTPVVLITAYPTAELEEQTLALGARAFLTKPVNSEELAMHIQSAMRQAP